MASSLGKIEHVVVLMMENRSFDHMLGYLKFKKGLPIAGLLGTEQNLDLDGNPVTVNHLADTIFPFDLGHSSADVRVQLKGNNSGFVTSYLQQTLHGAPPLAMGFYDETQVWAYDALVEQFAVCDHWYCALPGPTIPNRMFAVAGQSDGDTDQPPRGVKIYSGVRSIFDCLDVALNDVPESDRWGYYFHDLPMLALLEQHIRELLPIGSHRIRNIDTFFERVTAGNLPAVSWIDPNFADIGSTNCDHPPKSDIYDGQLLVATIYNALLSGGNNLFDKTLFIVTYDEHGGFYDHVVPVLSGDAAPFDLLGLRVPALLISPWIKAGTIDSTDRSHATMLKTIINRFAPNERLTPRVDRAVDLGGVLSEASARTDAAPIAIPARPAKARGFAARRGPAIQSGPDSLDHFLAAYRAELQRRGVSPHDLGAAGARTAAKSRSGKAKVKSKKSRLPAKSKTALVRPKK